MSLQDRRLPALDALNDEDCFQVIAGYHAFENVARLQLDSFNLLVAETIPTLIAGTTLPIDHVSGPTTLRFGDVHLQRPHVITDQHVQHPLYPHEAHIQNLHYEAECRADIEIAFPGRTVTYERVHLFHFPAMVRSRVCNLAVTLDRHHEPDEDCGGYFIINGKERTLVFQERINWNHVYVYEDRKSNSLVAEMRSVKEDADYSVFIRLRLVGTQIRVVPPHPRGTEAVALGIMLKAMGWNLYEFMDLFTHDPVVWKFVRPSVLCALQYSVEECMDMIADCLKKKPADAKRRRYYVSQILENEMFPHAGVWASSTTHGQYLALMAARLVDVHLGKRVQDDRDHVANKRVETSGQLVANLVRDLFKQFLKNIQNNFQKKPDGEIISVLKQQTQSFTKRIRDCFSTGNWGLQKGKYTRQGVSQILTRLSHASMVSHLRRLAIPIGKESKNTQLRQIHNSAFGFICPVETPEGQTSGIIKSFASMVRITEHVPPVLVVDRVQAILTDFGETATLDFRPHAFTVLVNGVIVGSIDEQSSGAFLDALHSARDTGRLDASVSIGWDPVDREFHLYCDEGRILRPLFNVHKYTVAEIAAEVRAVLASNVPIWTLEERRVVVFVDGNELDFMHVAMTAADLIPGQTRYLEIHPSLILGSCANIIPFPDHSQAPRNAYSSSMLKQAIGMYSTGWHERFDTSAHVLEYPQKRIVTTRYAPLMGMDDHPAGTNCVVAIACYTGFNMEDSILINQSAVDRGLFRSTSYKTLEISENKQGTRGSHRIEYVLPELRNPLYNYDFLNEDGLIHVGAIVKKNDVLVGCLSYNNEDVDRDISLVCGADEEGVVDKVCIANTGYLHVKIRIRSHRIMEIGDKAATLHGQKGTCGMIYRQEDMPFSNETGMAPDIILNSHAIPSRMTINMLLEELCGKAAALDGVIADATAFCHGDALVTDVGATLTKHGYDACGDEWFTNGMTGEPFKMKIFMGVCYYQRLKHMVADKLNIRSTGEVQGMTRQPPSGRARSGGLRIGEMEKDAFLAHGTSAFLKERLYDLSDPYEIVVCESCGWVVHAATKPCQSCGALPKRRLAIPHASKLLIQNLNSIGLKTRFY